MFISKINTKNYSKRLRLIYGFKKSLFIFSIFWLVSLKPAFSQTPYPQMANWYIGPCWVEIPTPVAFITQPACTTLNTVQGVPPHQATFVANGMYDNGTTPPNNHLLFYIANGLIYDYNNTLIYNLTIGATSAEVAIVPFGDNGQNANCQKKYNIFTTFRSHDTILLRQNILDMNSYSVTSATIDAIKIGTTLVEFGAIAVGQMDHSNFPKRFLYFMAGPGTIGSSTGQIKKIIINFDGSVSIPVTLPVVYPLIPYINAGAEVFSQELDLSPNGDWLAWASFAPENATTMPPQYRYHVIHLNSTGDFDQTIANNGAYQQFNIPGITGNLTSGFRGVEFWQSGPTTRLFLGAGADGIYYTDISTIAIPFPNNIPFQSNLTFTHVFSSNPNFGFSQIEYAHNGYMYASSPYLGQGIMNVGAFLPNIPNSSIDLGKSFTLGVPGATQTDPPKTIWQSTAFFTLPDQIDGEDYSAIIQAPVTQVATTYSYLFPVSNTTFGASATWSYGLGLNPWDVQGTDPVQVIQELHIRNNAILTIDGMLFKFSPGAKVIIEPGSTLILVNGAVLTSDYLIDPCIIPYTWKGVEVWGDISKTQNQIPPTQPLLQGKLVLQINSKIEYARCGAATYHPLDPPPAVYTTTGGIVVVKTNSGFKNCKIDVDFKPYENYVGTTQFIYNNQSSFNNAYFDNDLNYPFGAAPQHVIIDGCTGISFSACHFTNNATNALYPMNSFGIRAHNSSFIVDNSTDFNFLFHAIDVSKDKGNKSFTVKNSFFTDNQTGIYTKSIDNFILQNNQFTFGLYNKPGSSHYGVIDIFGSGFNIEENHFNSSGIITGVLKFGILCKSTSTGNADNQIYKNYFTGLDYGNFAFGYNKDINHPTLHGLQYICNRCTSNVTSDFFVSTSKSNSGEGIRLNQGTMSKPAGNIFSYINPLPTWHFNNSTGSVINYYYDSQFASNQQPTINYKVVLNAVSITNICPSTVPCPNCPQALPKAVVQELAEDYGTAETAYLSLLYTYNQLMDGGSTNALLTQMQQSWPTEATAYRDELLSRSPYLSQEILNEAANSNILPAAMLFMVCMANPDATRGNEFLTNLHDAIPNSLPQYMINLIIASWDNATARTAMENTLADYSQTMATTSNRILADYYYKNTQNMDSIDPTDTTNFPVQINYWLQRIQTLTAKYDLVENYYTTGEFTLAQDILDAIPYEFDLSEEQQAAYTDYCYFYQFRKNIYDCGQDLSVLNADQIQELVTFTEGDDNFAKGLAQNCLCFYYGICPEDNFDEPSSGNRAGNTQNAPESVNLSETKNDPANRVNVSPNPASEVATFNYFLPSIKENPVLSIYDMSGKEIAKFTIKNNQGQINWDTSTINSGVYYYFVKDRNTKIANGKITVKK